MTLQGPASLFLASSFLTFKRNLKKGGRLPNEPCFAGSDPLNASSPIGGLTRDGVERRALPPSLVLE